MCLRVSCRPPSFCRAISRPPRGFLIVDASLGIILAVVLAMVMTAAVIKQQHAQQQLAKIRAAGRDAEAAMLALQAGTAAPPDARIERLPDPAPANHRWVRLTIPAAGDRPAATLIGLVPTSAHGGPDR